MEPADKLDSFLYMATYMYSYGPGVVIGECRP